MKAVKNPDGSLTGNHLAAYNIGLMYFFGSGQLKQDGRTALRWFQTASQAYREAKKSKTAIFWPASLYSAQILQNGYAGVTADPTAARASTGKRPSDLKTPLPCTAMQRPFTATTRLPLCGCIRVRPTAGMCPP
jgi:TPR repeat protein